MYKRGHNLAINSYEIGKHERVLYIFQQKSSGNVNNSKSCYKGLTITRKYRVGGILVRCMF